MTRWLWHVDWGIDPKKRWVTRIHTHGTATPIIHEPAPFAAFSDQLFAGAYDDTSLVIGVDFPIGLPRVYAEAVGVADFRSFLRGEQGPAWDSFAAVAERLADVSLARPFFPRGRVHTDDKADGPPQKAWLDRLGLAKPDTYRQCDLMTGDRPAAASLFWTVGANQVGKAAIGGWRDLVRPLLRDRSSRLGLWPFDGDMETLMAKAPVVLAETYPGEIYGWFDCQPKAKTRREARLDVVPRLRAVATDFGLVLTDRAAAMLRDGFGDDARGEDRFDSFVGALGLYAIVMGQRAAPVPDDPIFRKVEGWILGQAIPDDRD